MNDSLFLPQRQIFFKQETKESKVVSQTGNVSELRKQLENKLASSKTRSEADKILARNWLHSDPKSFDAKELKTALTLFDKADSMITTMITEYTAKVQNAVKEGVASKEHEKEHIAWFRAQSFGDKIKYLKECDLDDPKRKDIARLYKKLPPEMQRGLSKEFAAARFEERIKIIETATELAKQYALIPAAVRKELGKKIQQTNLKNMHTLIEDHLAPHQTLKARFLALDEKLQEHHRDRFKGMGLEERAEFLDDMESDQKKEKTEAEKKEEREESFRHKMMGLIHQGLFSHRSFMAYDQWFSKLNAKQQQQHLEHSDLDDPQRIKIYNEFYSLPEKVRTPQQEVQFLNADLEGRMAILKELTGTTSPMGKINYPERAIQHALDTALNDESLRQKRIMFTIMHKIQIYSRRSEILEGRLADQMSEGKYAEQNDTSDPAERGGLSEEANAYRHTGSDEVKPKIFDAHMDTERRPELIKWVSADSLRDEKSRREEWRKAIVDIESTQGKDHAKIRGTGLYNKSNQMVGAEAFDAQVVRHLENELVAGVTRIASEQLPGVDQYSLRQSVEKLGLDIDLKQAIAH